MLKSKNSITTPPKGVIYILRDLDGGVYYKASDGSVNIADYYHDVYRISPITFSGYQNFTGEQIEILKSGPDEFIFALNKIIAVGGGRGGRSSSSSSGIQGITVKDNGVQVNGTITTVNFTGDGVTVTNGGGGTANVAIPGYVIASLTTSQREALIPTTALIVEDTDLDMYFKWSTVSHAWSPF